MASTPAAAPARRLRELPSSQFPGVRLKQSDVTQALLQDEPVAVSTLRDRENVSTFHANVAQDTHGTR